MAYNLTTTIKTFTMKKLTLIAIMLFTFQFVKAQTPADHALGIRFGGGDGVEAEISFQTFIGGNNRLEFDLGFEDHGHDNVNGFKFSLLYHWVGEVGSGFYWYVGAGGSLGGWNGEDDFGGDDDIDDGFFLDADGQLGIEYYFPIPIQVSLDLRPEFGLINDDFDFGYGFGIRYTF